ncbi:MAG: UDP-2,3-diacylglucosamine diphosphatase [Betaproteobacteria bacterium]|nr:UDP-2,3-diacylglucosamine diphosphatase [Betaproteobacteria bacterium]
MSHTLFISDLHLSEDTPLIRKRFLELLAGPAREAEALYILGDLFETWVGDDDMPAPFNRRIVEALHELTDAGTALFLMHGNRDFLLGEDFAQACGATLLQDPTEISLYGTRTLLSHGDQLCTDDVEYQAYRKQVRSAAWQRKVLALPLATRRQMARDATAMSEKAKQAKTLEIMDVAPQAVTDLLRKNSYPRLIHGHTHRPARHVYRLEDHSCERWVLPDWTDTRGGYLMCDSEGCRALPF